MIECAFTGADASGAGTLQCAVGRGSSLAKLASCEQDEVSIQIFDDERAGAPRFRSQCLVERYSLPLKLQEERLGIVSVSVAETASASGNGDSWRCRRRDPFRVDIGVRRGVRQHLHCELARLTEMERIACSAGASLRLPAKR